MMCESDALGGAEMVVLRLAQRLEARGCRVVGIGPHEAVQPDRRSNGWLRAEFARCGLEWRTYWKRRPIDPQLPSQLAGILRELGVTVAHSHEFVMAVYGTAATRRIGIRHVITMHGNMASTRRWTRRVALRWAFSRSEATVAVSDHTREHLESTLGLSRGRLRVIRNGVPEPRGDRARGRRAVNAADGDIVMLMVGSLIPRKGHLPLLRALTALSDGGPVAPWRLGIAGTGDQRGVLDAHVRDHGLADRVYLLGPRQDIPDLLAGADVFVMPSLWEGLPLALLEAMFAGKAIVASDVAGIPEAIVTERDGLLVPPGDEAGLRQALGRILSEPQLRTRLGQAARERAGQEFGMEAMVDAYEKLYFAGV